MQRETAEQEKRRKAEEAEDEAELSKYFAHVKKGDGKGKGKAVITEGDLDPTIQDGEDDEGDNSGNDEEGGGLLDLTVKRRPPPGSGGEGEPTVASLLAAKGKVLDSNGENGSTPGPAVVNQQQAKRKREGMQKLLGIKKKTKP